MEHHSAYRPPNEGGTAETAIRMPIDSNCKPRISQLCFGWLQARSAWYLTQHSHPPEHSSSSDMCTATCCTHLRQTESAGVS